MLAYRSVRQGTSFPGDFHARNSPPGTVDDAGLWLTDNCNHIDPQGLWTAPQCYTIPLDSHQQATYGDNPSFERLSLRYHGKHSVSDLRNELVVPAPVALLGQSMYKDRQIPEEPYTENNNLGNWVSRRRESWIR